MKNGKKHSTVIVLQISFRLYFKPTVVQLWFILFFCFEVYVTMMISLLSNCLDPTVSLVTAKKKEVKFM